MKPSVYTYFVQSVYGGPIKIGVTTDPDRRLATLQTGSPYELRIVALLPQNYEAEFHSLLAHARLEGEWFDETSEDVRYLVSWAQIESLFYPDCPRRAA